jgi:hypothetical protein
MLMHDPISRGAHRALLKSSHRFVPGIRELLVPLRLGSDLDHVPSTHFLEPRPPAQSVYLLRDLEWRTLRKRPLQTERVVDHKTEDADTMPGRCPFVGFKLASVNPGAESTCPHAAETLAT